MVTNTQKQVMFSGILGDGSIIKSGAMTFSCIHKEYLELKQKLILPLNSSLSLRHNNGYSKGDIYTLSMHVTDFGKSLFNYSISDILKTSDELMIALWAFDDGSLHKKDYFFNLNTHAIPLEIQENVLIPFLNKFNIFPKVYSETKKDGRKFNYLYISLWSGVFEISRILRKVDLDCYSYKMLPKELEDFYFDNKDTEEFKSKKTSYAKTCYLKKKLGLSSKDYLCEYFGTHKRPKK